MKQKTMISIGTITSTNIFFYFKYEQIRDRNKKQDSKIKNEYYYQQNLNVIIIRNMYSAITGTLIRRTVGSGP